MAEPSPTPIPIRSPSERSSQSVIREQTSNEFVFAVVGHIGAGVSTIAKDLKRELETSGFQVELLKAKDEITKWAADHGKSVPEPAKGIDYITALQDLGDEMRITDQAAVANALIRKIRIVRATKQRNVPVAKNLPVEPDGKLRAYILDSIRHPMEVQLLRQVYQHAFTLVGVVCNEDRRVERLSAKLHDVGRDNAKALMKRDADAPEKYGQRVADAFHLADYFIDNSEKRLIEQTANPNWTVAEKLSRLTRIILRKEVVRPTSHEMAMHIAYGAQVRSACMSRQVGAAILDQNGNVLSTGTNEVPRAGGGVYGNTFEETPTSGDHRCIYRLLQNDDGTPIIPYCSNTREQGGIVSDVVSSVISSDLLAGREDLTSEQKKAFNEILESCQDRLKKAIAKSPIGALLEFSRALHAEMDALLSAGREGKSTQGARMYVTTYPCHYCARHIVGAGIDEVQYIEPYPKSKALQLHMDSISESPPGWVPPSNGGPKVLFHSFTGVAPRMYTRAFQKDRELKDKQTGRLHIQDAEWGSAWDVSRVSYPQLEALLEASNASK
jgi:deoxycytidylate deaminase